MYTHIHGQAHVRVSAHPPTPPAPPASPAPPHHSIVSQLGFIPRQRHRSTGNPNCNYQQLSTTFLRRKPVSRSVTAASVVTETCGLEHFLPARALSKMGSLKLQTGEGCRGRTFPDPTETNLEQTHLLALLGTQSYILIILRLATIRSRRLHLKSLSSKPQRLMSSCSPQEGGSARVPLSLQSAQRKSKGQHPPY